MKCLLVYRSGFILYSVPISLMASKLINVEPHEAQNQLEVLLKEAYDLFKSKLRPPLKLITLSPEEYIKFNRAVLYGVLCDPELAEICIKHLHAAVNDGYQLFVMILVQIVNELYTKFVETAKVQLIWVTAIVVDVAGAGFNHLLVSLLRQIVGGDFSDANLWLSLQMVDLILSKWDLIIDEEPVILASALYVYLRLLADHYRLPKSTKSMELKRKEIEFCIKTLREQFDLCLKIGRDLIRLLQDLVHIPEFRAFWKDLIINPRFLRAHGFSNICQIYRTRTSSHYFLLRITPEMESKLRFLLTDVKFGSQRRHQVWFAKKFLSEPEKETVISDLVRFICCAHHPSNETVPSKVIPRWAVLGWLLKCCTRNYVEAKVKLALFYDWLFFDEKVDQVMNIEPAMLLMVNSIPRHADITNTLVEFLFILVDNYDVERKSIFIQGVSSAFSVLVQKGIVHSLDVLSSCGAVFPSLLERLKIFFSQTNSHIISHSQHDQVIPNSACLVENSLLDSSGSFPESGDVETCRKHVESSQSMSIDPAAPCNPSASSGVSEAELTEALIGRLGESLKQSRDIGLQMLERILFLYVNLDCDMKACNLSPETVASKINAEIENGGHKIFPSHGSPVASLSADEVQSATTVIIRSFVLTQNKKIREMLLLWSRNSHPVRSYLLYYASRLAYEVHMVIKEMPKDFLSSYATDSLIQQTCHEIMPLLKFHIDSYLASVGGKKDFSTTQVADEIKLGEHLLLMLVSDAYNSYKTILADSQEVHNLESKISLQEVLCNDLVACSGCKNKMMYSIFCGIFSFLPGLSVGEENVIQLLIEHLEDSELVSVQIDVSLARFSIFGSSIGYVLQLIRRSIQWTPNLQHRLWGLIRSELSVSRFPVEKLLLDIFCSADLASNHSSFVIEGLLMLCTSCAPTQELVGAIMLLPDDKVPNFSASVLANWVVSCSTMLFSSITEFLDKFEKNSGDATLDLGGVDLNKSALLYLMKYLQTHDERSVNSANKIVCQIQLDMKATIEKLLGGIL